MISVGYNIKSSLVLQMFSTILKNNYRDVFVAKKSKVGTKVLSLATPRSHTYSASDSILCNNSVLHLWDVATTVVLQVPS